jgi:hypothetical protein
MNEKKITESARGEECTVRIPSICNGNPETVVFAHVNGIRFGHGFGKKTKFGAYCCSECHSCLDGRIPRPAGMTYEQAKLAHYEGVIETLNKLVEKGLL